MVDTPYVVSISTERWQNLHNSPHYCHLQVKIKIISTKDCVVVSSKIHAAIREDAQKETFLGGVT
jgi:hypothetical protein